MCTGNIFAVFNCYLCSVSLHTQKNRQRNRRSVEKGAPSRMRSGSWELLYACAISNANRKIVFPCGVVAGYILTIGVASGMAGRALALPIMPPERDIAACAKIELLAECSLAHVMCVCAQPIIYSLLRPC